MIQYLLQSAPTKPSQNWSCLPWHFHQSWYLSGCHPKRKPRSTMSNFYLVSKLPQVFFASFWAVYCEILYQSLSLAKHFTLKPCSQQWHKDCWSTKGLHHGRWNLTAVVWGAKSCNLLQGILLMERIRRSPVEVGYFIPLFTRVLYIQPVVGNGISEPSTVFLLSGKIRWERLWFQKPDPMF